MQTEKGDAELKPYSLYGTSACHLCELAEALVVAALRNGAQCIVQDIDISESDDLMARYGERIPVLRHPDGRELNWPFSAEEVERFLAA
jgi:hypothetical protein